MRHKSVVLLFRLFWLFIVRRVLGRGLLASPVARLSALFLVLAAFAGFNVLSYVVIRQYLGGPGLLEPVLQGANASVGFWVLIAYTTGSGAVHEGGRASQALVQSAGDQQGKDAGIRALRVIRYLRLIGSQGVLLIAVAIPVMAMSMAQGVAFDACLPVAGFCLRNILISTLIGIAFPPEKGNPFTVIIGVLLTVIVAMIVALGLNVFNIEPAISESIYAELNYIILGMQRMERIARHEVAA
jgi:hypothetical protein